MKIDFAPVSYITFPPTFKANPPVGKDQPPDLASLVPLDAITIPGQPDKAAPLQVSDMNHAPVHNKSTGVSGKLLGMLMLY